MDFPKISLSHQTADRWTEALGESTGGGKKKRGVKLLISNDMLWQ